MASLSENIMQSISDFKAIKEAINNNPWNVMITNEPTSSYSSFITELINKAYLYVKKTDTINIMKIISDSVVVDLAYPTHVEINDNFSLLNVLNDNIEVYNE